MIKVHITAYMLRVQNNKYEEEQPDYIRLFQYEEEAIQELINRYSSFMEGVDYHGKLMECHLDKANSKYYIRWNDGDWESAEVTKEEVM